MHYLQNQLDDFVTEIETLVHNHYKNRFPNLELPKIGVDNGRKYWRIWKADGSSKSVFGFVRKDDGAILKAATWKAPQTKTKTAVRGYLTDEDRINTCTAYGVVYAR